MSRKHAIALLWVLLMAGGMWLSATHVAIHSELADLLPEGTTATQRLLLNQARSGLAGRLLLLGLEGGDVDALAEASRELSERLRASGRFTLVENGAQDIRQQRLGIVFESRYLLSPMVGPDAFSRESLRRALENRLDDLRSPLAPLVKTTIPEDPTGEFFAVVSTWSGADRPQTYRGVWFSKDRSKALMLIETKAAGFDADAQAAIQQDVRDIFASLRGRPAQLHLLMTGAGVFAVEAKQTIEREAWRLSTAAAALVLLFLYVSYRSITLVLLSLIPLTAGVMAGMLAVQGWFGFIHGITLGFGITLLGVVDDYPIHLFSHLSSRGSAAAVVQEIWPTMRIGVLTTAIGFAALLFAGFPALTQLGLFAVTGILTAAAVTRWVLPNFVPGWFLPRAITPALPAKFERLGRMKPLMPVAILLACATLFWSHTPLWETELSSISPVSEAKKQLDGQIREELGAPDVRDLLVIEGQTDENVLQYGEAAQVKLQTLRANGAIGGYDLVSNYLPSRRTQQDRQSHLPEPSVLRRNLDQALKGLPFAPDLFAPFVAAVESARTKRPLERKAMQDTALGTRIASLMFEHGGGWTAIVPLRRVADRKQLAQIVADWNMPAVRYVDLKTESNRLMSAYRDRTFLIVVCGLLVISVVLAVGIKSLTELGPILFPIMSALAVVAAVLNLSGESLSLFHIATFLLVIGLGLDYTLFFNRPEGSEEGRSRTLYGLLVCSTTTMLVFGVLAGSSIPVLHAIGMTAAVGSFCCLLFAGIMARKELYASA
ncbi:MAG TPA: MMPL family transporter [Nitrospira sp.]|nr:MMPL family transporter [Nitrospira sp.]